MRAQTTMHPRCGTTFLVLVVLVGIVLGSLVGPLVVPNPSGWLGGAQSRLPPPPALVPSQA